MQKSNLCSIVRVLVLALAFGLSPSCSPVSARGSVGSVPASRLAQHKFPKLANQFQHGDKRDAFQTALDQLYLWDLVVVNDTAVDGMPEYLGSEGAWRRKNPNLVILAYHSAGDVLPDDKSRIGRDFIDGMKDDWFMKDASGSKVKFFQLSANPDRWTLMQNPATGLQRYMPEYLNRAVLETQLVDGMFYDWASTSLAGIFYDAATSTFRLPDIHRNGGFDSRGSPHLLTPATFDAAWEAGYAAMLQHSRDTFPSWALVMGNVGWNGGTSYAPKLNGVLIEKFMEGAKGNVRNFGWSAIMRTVSAYVRSASGPETTFIMANGEPTELALMRFGFTSALMFDAYSCFTNTQTLANDQLPYQSAFWFDEYAVDLSTGTAVQEAAHKGYLGLPVSDPYFAGAGSAPADRTRLLAAALAALDETGDKSVWRRDFEHGAALVNPTSASVTVPLGGTYRKIRGAFSSDGVNDGSINLTSVSVPAQSGLVLLR